MDMEKLNLTPQAQETVKKLASVKESDSIGRIAAIDPETGETFYGNSVAEATKKGRQSKNNPQAAFFFVRVGFPSVHVLKRVVLQGEIQQEYFPKIRGFIQDTHLNLMPSIRENTDFLELMADTGFSGALVLDSKVLEKVEKDYVGVDTVTLAGGNIQQVSMYLILQTFSSINRNSAILKHWKWMENILWECLS